MKAFLAVLALGLVGGVAHAEPIDQQSTTNPGRRLVVPISPERAAELAATPATVQRIIYMNNCAPNGCTIHPGNSNSASDTSGIAHSTSLLGKYAGSAAQWDQIVNCVKQTYAPFNVQIVTTRPAAGTGYHMAVVGGHPQDIGLQSGVLGISEIQYGIYIPSEISYSFANEEPTNILDLCWTVAQESAHAFGLDHKYDNRDPMTYLTTGPAQKAFQNQAGACGEYSARACGANYNNDNKATMNSYQEIMKTFGASGPDTTPPVVTITSPTNNASVMGGFTVKANVTDDIGVTKAELRVDGTLSGSVTAAPFQFTAPATLAGGSHTVEVTAYDGANNTAKASITVSVPTGCTGASDCTNGEVCDNSQCVPGPGAMGGLGSTCTGNADCASGQCASDGMNKYCVSVCDPAKDACPSSFSCLAAGAGGVCWPTGDNGGDGGSGGCNTGSSSGSGVLLFGLGLAVTLITRRRR